MRQALEQQYDVSALTEIENDIKSKEQALTKVQEAIQQINKVGVNQQRAMLDLNQGEELPVKLRALNDEIRKAKAATKETSDKVKDIDRSNQEQHR